MTQAWQIFISLLVLSLSYQVQANWTGDYRKFLQHMVSEQGVLWSALDQDKLALFAKIDKALDQTTVPGRAKRAELQAFWINAHNICVFKKVIKHRPIEDLMSIGDFMTDALCKVSGQSYSLIQIQSDLRQDSKDPRIHFVLWRGTKGGPRLLAEVFTKDNLEQLLEQGTRVTLARKDFVNIVQPYGDVYVSMMLEWFKHDFTSTRGNVIGFLRPYLPKDQARQLPAKDDDLKLIAFDWMLDNQP